MSVITWHALSGAKRFEAVLRQRPCARSEHFTVHKSAGVKLSTGNLEQGNPPVDDHPSFALGLVVPKRFAKRAVTRNLIKRQIRAAMDRHLDLLTPADWVVRLRAPIDRTLFVSARSAALAAAMRTELDALMRQLDRLTPQSAA